jgi:rhamnosyltransferase
MPKVSIIIRTKNEERWVGRCLRMVYQQDFKDFEVILVDNKSTDNTVALALKFPVKLVVIDKYLPGLAINKGVEASTGELIVCLSAHCIPRDEKWLSSLVAAMADPSIAGAYGRQLPMSYSSDLDKRDLINTFGLDRRIQVKDGFFHNANSMVRRSMLEKVPFDAAATNIEDRIWGEKVVKLGHRLAYEPDAAVYHYHGIHQNQDAKRASSVVRILESIQELHEHRSLPSGFKADSMNTIAILPVQGAVERVGGVDLLERAIRQVKAARFVGRVAVVAEDRGALETAECLGARGVPRPPELSGPRVGTEEVLRHALRACEDGEVFYDAALYVNYLYPFRPEGFFDDMIDEFARTGVDTLVPTLKDFQPFWAEKGDELVRCDTGLLPSEFKSPMHRGILGMGCVTSCEFIRAGRLLGEEIGLVPFDETLYSVRMRDDFSRSVIALALEKGEATFGARSAKPDGARGS